MGLLPSQVTTQPERSLPALRVPGEVRQPQRTGSHVWRDRHAAAAAIAAAERGERPVGARQRRLTLRLPAVRGPARCLTYGHYKEAVRETVLFTCKSANHYVKACQVSDGCMSIHCLLGHAA